MHLLTQKLQVHCTFDQSERADSKNIPPLPILSILPILIMSGNMKRQKRKSVSKRRRSNRVNADYNTLEQRLALTTFVVTSLADVIGDDGLVTFREAIVAANTNAASGDAAAGEATGDVIQFDPSLADGTINLTEGQLTISDDLTVQAGGLNITVDAQGQSRAFEITGSERVSLGRINVTGGVADIGGGVLASGSGNLIVFGGVYSDNVATGDGGGAIYSAGGNLNVSGGATFEGNLANGTSGSGGAIFNEGGTAVANDVTFFDNVANRAGGAIEITGGDLFLTSITAFRNVAGPEGSAAPGNGGVLHVTAGDTVVVRDSALTVNRAASEGGALWNQAGTRLLVFNSDINFNSALGDGADNGGGAIFNNGGDLVISGGGFTTNTATGTAGSGGAIFSVDGRIVISDEASFIGNSSSRAGGAIEIVDGELFDTDSGYSANNAGGLEPASTGNGGAIHITGTALSAFSGTRFFVNSAASEGGGFWNSAESSVFFNNDVDFSFNSAFGNDADNGGGAIFNNGGAVVVNGGTFSTNTASGTAGSGGAILSVDGRVLVQADSEFRSNRSARAGGAVELIDGEFFDTNSLYVSNRTGFFQDAGEFVEISPGTGNGGAFHITGTGTSAFFGTQLMQNVAANEGGAVWNSASSSIFLTDALLSDNTANGDDADNGGGALFNNGGDVFVNGSLFFGNDADGTAGSGGAIFSVDGRVVVTGDSQFSDNRSVRAGGAIEIIDGDFFDTDTFYSGNSTGDSLPANPGNGGAFHVTGTATSAFNGTFFSDNRAGSEGGAIWNAAGSTMFLTDVVISSNIASGNSADNGGGGIFNNGGSVFVNNSSLSGNFANGDSGSGGGALSVAGVLRFDNSTIIDNRASRAGGGVEVIDGRAVFRGVSLSSNTTGVSLTAAPGNGGGLHVTGNQTVVTFSDSSVVGNSAANQGGGLWNQTGSTLILDDNTRITQNSVQGQGGGVYNRGILSAIDAAFIENSSDDDGGAIFITATGDARIEDTSFDFNSADDDGGGIFNLGSLVSTGSSFAQNTAGDTGGAIFTGANATTTAAADNFFADNFPNDQTG